MGGLRRRLAAVQLLVLDVDGVLTDGGLLMTGSGEVLRRYDVRDGLGLRLLAGAGLRLALLSGAGGGSIEARARQLGIDRCLTAVRDKQAALGQLQADLAGADFRRLDELTQALADLCSRIDTAEGRWLELSERATPPQP